MKAFVTVGRIALSLMIGLAFARGANGQTLHREFTGRGAELNAISFPTDSIGVAVGDSGVTMVTADAGATWSKIPLLSTDVLYAAFFNDQNSGAIGGDNGRMYVTAGQSRFPVQLPEIGTIYGITYPSYDVAIAVGGSGLIYRTLDSGRTWKKIPPPPIVAGRDLYGVESFNATTYWVVGHGGLALYTPDGGVTWDTSYLNTKNDLYSVSFPDSSGSGWIVGDQVLFYSSDNGTSWSQNRLQNSALLRQVIGYDTLHAYAVGLSGTMLTTSNAVDWTPIETGTTANFWCLSVPDTNFIYIAGDSAIVMTNQALTKPKPTFSVTNDIFDSIVVGSSEVNSNLIITNNSNQDTLVITSAIIDSSQFEFDPIANVKFPFIILPGRSQSLEIRFTPRYVGAVQCNIRISSNFETIPTIAQLRGVGVAAAGVADNSAPNPIRFTIASGSKRAAFEIPGNLTPPFHLDISNTLGESVLSKIITDDWQVDGSGLLTGAYFYHVTSPSGSAIGKFILR